MNQSITNKTYEFSCCLDTEVIDYKIAYYAEIDKEPYFFDTNRLNLHVLADNKVTALSKAFELLGETEFSDCSIKEIER